MINVVLLIVAVKLSEVDPQKRLFCVQRSNRLEPLNVSQPHDSWKLRALSMTGSQRVEPAELSAGADNTLQLRDRLPRLRTLLTQRRNTVLSDYKL